MNAVVTPPTLVSLLTPEISDTFGIVIGSRLFTEVEEDEDQDDNRVERQKRKKKGHPVTFKNARLIGAKITELLANTSVSEICVCANAKNVEEVQAVMDRITTERKLKRNSETLPKKGKAWIFKFEG